MRSHQRQCFVAGHMFLTEDSWDIDCWNTERRESPNEGLPTYWKPSSTLVFWYIATAYYSTQLPYTV